MNVADSNQDVNLDLRTTALAECSEKTLAVPGEGMVTIQFPDENDRRARIRRCSGRRMLEWDGEKWNAFERESRRWYVDVLSEADYATLRHVLHECSRQ